MTRNNHNGEEQAARKITDVRDGAGMREEHKSQKTDKKSNSIDRSISAESNRSSFVERPIKERTRNNYHESYQSMCNYSENKLRLQGIGEELTLRRVAEDMFERVDLKHGTKIAYSASLKYIFMQNLDKNEYRDAIDYVLRKIDLLKESENKKPRKRNCIAEKDYHKILKYLELWGKNAEWALLCEIAVRATVSAGLRPLEWDSAKWKNRERGELYVKNAKVKNSPPAFYKITQDEWNAKKLTERIVYVESEIARCYVDAQIRSLEAFKMRTKKGIKEFNDALRDALRKVCIKIWSKSKYTFRDMRGQFSANARWIYGPEKAAEMMGHSGPDTPSRGRYGGANQAFPSIKKEIPRHKANERHQDPEPPPRPRDVG